MIKPFSNFRCRVLKLGDFAGGKTVKSLSVVAALILIAFAFPFSVYAAPLFWNIHDETSCESGESGSSATWDAATRTCTLTGGFSGYVTITVHNADITLDGAGHTIYLTGAEDVRLMCLTGLYKGTLKNVYITGDPNNALQLNGCNGATVSNVSISGSMHFGIELIGATNALIESSSVSGAYAAIVSYTNSSGNRIENNTLTGSYGGSSGISYDGSHPRNNVITGNTISNFDVGVEEYPYSGNTYYRNNFIDNSRPIYGPPFDVTYSLSPPEGGNYYNSYDEAGDDCNDSEPDGFCDVPYSLGFSAFDDYPWTTQDGWVDAKGTVTATGGGTVSSDDGSIEIDVAAGSIVKDTTIYAYLDETPVPDVMIGDNADSGDALATYEFGPDGTEFYPAALLTLKIDVTALSAAERAAVSIYRHEDTDGDGDIDSDDGYNKILGASCTVSEDPPGTFTATCTADIDHFSTYAIILVSQDSDGDGISDGEDTCPDENSAGFDVDSDGCIDSFAGLTDLVTDFVNSGDISKRLEKSLISKIRNANKSVNKYNICDAITQLESFQSQVEAQRDKKIVSEDAANDLLDYANSIITYYSGLLDIGETCL